MALARIVLASANPKKVDELRAILADGAPGVVLVPRPDDVAEVVEDAPDFIGNARLKARALCGATGEAALADDSGLEVDALDGAPGVRSARYGGDGATDADNVALVLDELRGAGALAVSGRRARFRCVIVLRYPDDTELVAEGTVEGSIGAGPSGDGGFGYDPVFVPDDGDGRTFAEMTPAEKHAISHRGRALRSLVDQLR
jgi:XTP/dITP diphosphohydrolase